MPVEVLRVVYDWFENWCRFPIRADDRIADYGIADDDFEDAVLEVLARCERQPPPGTNTIVIPSVRDFALFIATSPRTGAVARNE